MMEQTPRERLIARWEAARAKDGWVVPKGEVANAYRMAVRIDKMRNRPHRDADLSIWEMVAGLAEAAKEPLTAEQWKQIGRINGRIFGGKR